MIMVMDNLYGEMILEHNKSPRNFREMDPCTNCAGGHNPLCGDKIVVYLKVEGDVIEDVCFQGDGCAISTASASILTTEIKGKKVSEARELFFRFIKMLTSEDPIEDDLGKLVIFSGVKEFPVRVKCATLAWHTLVNALEKSQAVAKTE